jgi:cobalt-precorrin 5A hydrolase
MERQQMSRLVIGLGFRDQASAAAIGEVLLAAIVQAGSQPSLIAVPDDKSGHAGLLAAAMGAKLPIAGVTREAMRRADPGVATRSAQIENRRGVGSVCEAAALAAAGFGARLIVGRLVSSDRTATAAAAIREEMLP